MMIDQSSPIIISNILTYRENMIYEPNLQSKAQLHVNLTQCFIHMVHNLLTEFKLVS